MTTHYLWVAESDNGSVQFDAEPSTSDVLNCCEDLEFPIEVYAIEALETSRALVSTIRNND